MLFSEETFGSVGFESIFMHLEIISNGQQIKVLNDSIDLSKSKSHNEPKVSPVNVFGALIYMSYFGAIGTPVLDFWWCLLWVSKPSSKPMTLQAKTLPTD